VARFVLDTNIISQILHRNAAAVGRLREAVENEDDLFMCPVVLYELWRGLRHRGADRQLAELEDLGRAPQWVDYDRAVLVDAAELWASSAVVAGRRTTRTC
jgi:predicted nucleic acid-binding protein